MKELENEWTRRKFLATSAGAGALIALNPLWSWAANRKDPDVSALVARTMGIDTHNHIDVPLNRAELPGPAVDLAGDMKTSGLSAICMTFAVDYQQLKEPGDAYNRFFCGLDAMDALLAANNMTRALNMKDLKAAHKKHVPTVIQSVEGAHFLEGKLDRLQEAYDRGLRHLGLLHDNDASVPLGDIYTKPPQWGGLTSLGADTIRECERLGIVIDLTHCSNDTIDAALKIATKPVLISHTGLNTQLGQNPNMAQMMMPRLISKEQAKIVANAGGVIGVWNHLAASPVEYVQNIKAMVDVVGVDHVCIGTDTKLTTPYRSPASTNRKPEDGANKPEGQGGPGGPGGPGGGNQNRSRAGERTNEAWPDQKTGFYYTVVENMLNAGFSETEIAKIGGGNYARIFDAATSGH